MGNVRKAQAVLEKPSYKDAFGWLVAGLDIISAIWLGTRGKSSTWGRGGFVGFEGDGVRDERSGWSRMGKMLKKQTPSSQCFILWHIIPMPVVGCSQHHLNSLSERLSPELIKPSCQREATEFLLCPGALPTLRGSEMMSFFLSDPGVGGW